MANKYSLTVKTVLCIPILTLYGCSGEFIEDAELKAEAALAESTQAPEVTSQIVPLPVMTITDTTSSEISLGAANPTDISTSGLTTSGTGSALENSTSQTETLTIASAESIQAPLVTSQQSPPPDVTITDTTSSEISLGAANPTDTSTSGLTTSGTGSALENNAPQTETPPITSAESIQAPLVTSQQSPPPDITITDTSSSEIPLGAVNPTDIPTSELTTSSENSSTNESSNLATSTTQPGTTIENETPVVDTEFPESGSPPVIDILPDSTEEELVAVDYTPVPEAPIEGELVPYGNRIEFVWSIPAVLVGVVTGFDITIADAAERDVYYRNNLIEVSSCTDQGVCTFEIESADVPIIEGENIWSVSSLGDNVSFNIAEASFALDKAPESTEEPAVETPVYSDDFLAIKADADEVLADYDNWWFNKGTVLRTQQGYHSKAALNGIAQIYKTTGESAYLDRGIQVAHHWIDSGAQIDNDGYLDWEGEDNGQTNINLEHTEWRAAAGIADILVEIQRTGYEGGIPGTKAKFIQYLKREVWEKWTSGHQIYSAGWRRSARGTRHTGNNGRWALIAMGLDQTHATPGNNEYNDFLTSTTGPNEVSAYGQLFPSMIRMENAGQRYFPGNTDGSGPVDDTSHIGDTMYAILRAKQLGYDPDGYMDQFLGVYKRLLNDKMFPTSAGFTEYTDGSGGTNNSNWSSSHGHSLSAALDSALLARWVQFVRHNNPYFYGVNESPDRTLWMAGGLLFALNGGKL